MALIKCYRLAVDRIGTFDRDWNLERRLSKSWTSASYNLIECGLLVEIYGVSLRLSWKWELVRLAQFAAVVLCDCGRI